LFEVSRLSEGKLGRGYIITNSNTTDLGVKKTTLNRKMVIGPTAIRFVTVVIIAILAVVYLSQSTAGAGRSVKLREIEGKKSEMILERERLQTEQTRLKSLREIDKGVNGGNIETIKEVGHLEGAI